MSKSKEGKAFLNYYHNELGITKETIRRWTKAAVERVAERQVKHILEERFSDYQVKKLVDDVIRNKERDWLWGESEDTFDTYVKKEVVSKLLNGVKLKVEITKNKKDASIPHETVRVRRTKRR